MNSEVYDFLDDQLNHLVNKFFDNLDGIFTRSELNVAIDEHEISYEIYKFQKWLEENNYESEVDDIEISIIAKEFKKAVIKKFKS